jgi:serine protease AprX
MPTWLKELRFVLVLVFALGLVAPGVGATGARAEAGPTGLKIAPTLLSRITTDPLTLQPVIVEMSHAGLPFGSQPNLGLAQQALSLLSAAGVPVRALPIVDSAAGWLSGAGIQALALLPNVAYIHDDTTVSPRRGTSQSPAWPPGQLSSLYPQETRADRVWGQAQGAGVTVAILDSGVAADPDLGARVVAAVSFAGGRNPNLPDPGGHGTHVAGIVAGSGTRSQGQFIGMAPGANIVDVQVLDANGNGRLSSVVAGIGWVVAHRTQYNIRVINLSFGAPPPPSYHLDPLSAAVEIAWQRGLVVVAATGNTGPGGNSVASPGIDPFAVTVGATDDQGTLTLTDDTLAWFSSWGTPTDGRPKPDLVAPGRRLVSIRVPGSTLDGLFPDHVVGASNGSSYFRLTGTSQATPVVSGAAALVLARQPNLTPDQVKAILTGTTQRYGPNGSPLLPDPSADGAGMLDASAAFSSGPRGAANAGLRPSDGYARAMYPHLYGQPVHWKNATSGGILWNLLTWLTLSWTNIAWDNIAWDSFNSSNIAWDNIAWDTTSWDNIAWDRSDWDNIAWDNVLAD